MNHMVIDRLDQHTPDDGESAERNAGRVRRTDAEAATARRTFGNTAAAGTQSAGEMEADLAEHRADLDSDYQALDNSHTDRPAVDGASSHERAITREAGAVGSVTTRVTVELSGRTAAFTVGAENAWPPASRPTTGELAADRGSKDDRGKLMNGPADTWSGSGGRYVRRIPPKESAEKDDHEPAAGGRGDDSTPPPPVSKDPPDPEQPDDPGEPDRGEEQQPPKSNARTMLEEVYKGNAWALMQVASLPEEDCAGLVDNLASVFQMKGGRETTSDTPIRSEVRAVRLEERFATAARQLAGIEPTEPDPELPEYLAEARAARQAQDAGRVLDWLRTNAQKRGDELGIHRLLADTVRVADVRALHAADQLAAKETEDMAGADSTAAGSEVTAAQGESSNLPEHQLHFTNETQDKDPTETTAPELSDGTQDQDEPEESSQPNDNKNPDRTGPPDPDARGGGSKEPPQRPPLDGASWDDWDDDGILNRLMLDMTNDYARQHGLAEIPAIDASGDRYVMLSVLSQTPDPNIRFNVPDFFTEVEELAGQSEPRAVTVDLQTMRKHLATAGLEKLSVNILPIAYERPLQSGVKQPTPENTVPLPGIETQPPTNIIGTSAPELFHVQYPLTTDTYSQENLEAAGLAHAARIVIHGGRFYDQVKATQARYYPDKDYGFRFAYAQTLDAIVKNSLFMARLRNSAREVAAADATGRRQSRLLMESRTRVFKLRLQSGLPIVEAIDFDKSEHPLRLI